jgi:hypothetical protein
MYSTNQPPETCHVPTPLCLIPFLTASFYNINFHPEVRIGPAMKEFRFYKLVAPSSILPFYTQALHYKV